MSRRGRFIRKKGSCCPAAGPEKITKALWMVNAGKLLQNLHMFANTAVCETWERSRHIKCRMSIDSGRKSSLSTLPLPMDLLMGFYPPWPTTSGVTGNEPDIRRVPARLLCYLRFAACSHALASAAGSFSSIQKACSTSKGRHEPTPRRAARTTQAWVWCPAVLVTLSSARAHAGELGQKLIQGRDPAMSTDGMAFRNFSCGEMGLLCRKQFLMAHQSLKTCQLSIVVHSIQTLKKITNTQKYLETTNNVTCDAHRRHTHTHHNNQRN